MESVSISTSETIRCGILKEKNSDEMTRGNKSLHSKPTSNPIAKDDFAPVAQETIENVEPFTGIFSDTGSDDIKNETTLSSDDENFVDCTFITDQTMKNVGEDIINNSNLEFQDFESLIDEHMKLKSENNMQSSNAINSESVTSNIDLMVDTSMIPNVNNASQDAPPLEDVFNGFSINHNADPETDKLSQSEQLPGNNIEDIVLGGISCNQINDFIANCTGNLSNANESDLIMEIISGDNSIENTYEPNTQIVNSENEKLDTSQGDTLTMLPILNKVESLDAGDVGPMSVDLFNDIRIEHNTDNETKGNIETGTPVLDYPSEIENKMPEEDTGMLVMENITSDHKPDNIANFSLLLSKSNDENPILDNNNEIISNGNSTEHILETSKHIVNFNNDTFDSSEGYTSTMMNDLNKLEILDADQCNPISDDVDNNLFNKHNTEDERDFPKIMDVRLEFELQLPQEKEEIRNLEVMTIDRNTDSMPDFKFVLPNSIDENPISDKNNHGIISGDNAINNTLQTNIQIANVKNEKFESSEGFNFAYSDFDCFTTKGGISSATNPFDVHRPSVLLKFDPLLKKPEVFLGPYPKSPELIHNNVEMNMIIDNNLNSHKINEGDDLQMAESERKVKNDVSRTEELEKKLKEAEMQEEALLKRISEKDKIIAKMTGVVEAYEKTIAETIADKENSAREYEKQIGELRTDRDLNAEHLASLEITFSDLHAKYERTKIIALNLKENEAGLMTDVKKYAESLKKLEQYYDKMKTHAISQLDLANNKLNEITKAHNLEVTKLKALLKKEEISRASVNEQLNQKSKENEELVKICDELINGGSTS